MMLLFLIYDSTSRWLICRIDLIESDGRVHVAFGTQVYNSRL